MYRAPEVNTIYTKVTKNGHFADDFIFDHNLLQGLKCLKIVFSTFAQIIIVSPLRYVAKKGGYFRLFLF